MKHRDSDVLGGRVAPWSMPVPVRAAEFEPLWPQHASLAVETDLGAIASFGVTPQGVAEDCAHCDFQLLADYPAHRRLGSGRAAFYKGKYLKGLGRTPLAANWAECRDAWHGTGHMQASAAIRELVVTRYLQAKGLGHCVVPCEGILVRRMSPEFRRSFREYAAGEGLQLAPIDHELQAISIKPADFARWSNFLWLLVNAPANRDTVSDFGWLLECYARGPHRPRPSADSCTPVTIVRAMSDAMAQAASNFKAYFLAGVYWGSFCNNSTMDGRFLDLELPTVLGEGRFYGVLPCSAESSGGRLEHMHTLGAEVLDHARQMRSTITQVRRRLADLEDRTSSHLLRAFIRALRDEMDTVFDEDHWVWSRHRQRELMAWMYEGVRTPRELDRAIEGMIAEGHREPPGMAVTWTPAGLRIAKPEPGVRMDIHVPAGHVVPDGDQAAAERTVVTQALDELDALTAVDELLSQTHVWLDRITNTVNPLQQRAPQWNCAPKSDDRRAS
ncbi:MAG: hypothetical protein K0V04_30735 [Deltaproteobacteria bacterium]|nr:hypothetical protein [Deltaproteobacteria bacterium]